MRISFTPERRDDTLTLHRAGDVLTINGQPYDFGPLPEGGRLPQVAVVCPWLASDVTRQGGVLHLTLILPHGANAPQETRFPVPLTLEVDGPVTLPIHSLPSEVVE